MAYFIQKVLLALSLLAPKQSPCDVYGRIRFVSSDADFKVFITNAGQKADLDVVLVDDEPLQPGKWQKVHRRPDFSIQIVEKESDADFTIRFVPAVRGCR